MNKINKIFNYYYLDNNSYVYDISTISFMEKLEIPNDSTIFYFGTPQQTTGTQLWDYIEELTLNLKGKGNVNSSINFWDNKNIKIFYPIMGGTEERHKINLININSYPIDFNGNWTHTSTGAQPDGVNSYGDIGITPNMLNSSSINFGRWNGEKLGVSGIDVGATNISNNQTWASFSNYAGSFYFTTNDYTTSFVFDDLGIGAYWVNKTSYDITQGYRQGLLVGSVTQSAVPLEENFYYGALNVGGSPSFFDTKELQEGHFLDGLNEDEAYIFYRIIQQYQSRLNRIAINAYFYGDSTTQGTGASNPIYKWATLVCKSKNWVEINNGAQGTTLENAIPVNQINSPNMYQNRTNVPTFVSGSMAALFYSYNINDCGLNYPTYNTGTYSSQLNDIIDTAISKGWPLDKIILITGLYCTEANWSGYLTYGVPLPADNARHLTFITASIIIAENKGIVKIDPYQDMINAGGTGPDGRHPDDFIYSVIANTSILPKITNL